MKTPSRLLLVACTLALVACGPHRQLRTHELDIHGTNDLVPVSADGGNVPQAYRAFLDGIGNIEGGCTVSYVGNGVAVTAGHCLPSLGDCTAFRISWGDRVGRPPYLKSRCDRVLAASDDDKHGDYALILVDPVPRVALPFDLSQPPTTGERVTLFSHPDERPLAWSQYSRLAPLGPNSPFVVHQCDTLGGSSGGAILDAATGRIVAVHDRSDGTATRLDQTPLATYLSTTY